MVKKGIYIAVIISCLLLILIIFRKRRSEFDNFFSDVDIVKDFAEPTYPTAVPGPLMNTQVSSGNGTSECEQNGYVSMTLTNPSTLPITVDLINLSGYISGGAGSTATETALPGPVSIINSYNGIVYSINFIVGDLYITDTNVTPSITSTLSLAPDFVGGAPTVGNIIFLNGNAYISGNAFTTVVNTATNTIIAQLALPGITNLNTFNNRYSSVFGNNVYVVSTSTDLTTMYVSIIDSITNTIISSVSAPANPFGNDIIFPEYNYGAVYPKCYIQKGSSTELAVFSFESNTFLPSITSPSLSGTPYGAALANNLLYVPGLNGIDIINPVTDTFIGTISIPGETCTFVNFNNQTSLYVSLQSGSIKVIDITTNLVINTINTGFIALLDTYIFQGILYAGDSDISGNVIAVNVTEGLSTTNNITNTYNLSPAAFFSGINLSSTTGNNSIILAGFNGTFPDFVGYIANVPAMPPITNTQVIGLNNMQNFINNPGEICGIFYRSLTVAQMSNVFSVQFTDPLGSVTDYKLIPITHKDTMSVLNQIYIDKFFKKILINNGLSIFHVVNPGENIYIKIYVKDYVSNVEMLKTGKIKSVSTGTSSVFGKGNEVDPNGPEDEDSDQEDSEENEKQEDEWLTIDEVEEEEWEEVHIQLPEDEEIEYE